LKLIFLTTMSVTMAGKAAHHHHRRTNLNWTFLLGEGGDKKLLKYRAEPIKRQPT